MIRKLGTAGISLVASDPYGAPPTITAPAPITVEATGNYAASVTISGGTAFDNAATPYL